MPAQRYTRDTPVTSTTFVIESKTCEESISV